MSSMSIREYQRSMLRIDANSRYAMLETVREFALDQLRASGELETVARAHAVRFLTLAEQMAPPLATRSYGSLPAGALGGRGRLE